MKFRQEVEQRQLSGRIGTSEDVGQATAFLASDEASYITGSSIMVDNGMTALLEILVNPTLNNLMENCMITANTRTNTYYILKHHLFKRGRVKSCLCVLISARS